eukprot:6922615-Pyramimonas_sp.AAC.1
MRRSASQGILPRGPVCLRHLDQRCIAQAPPIHGSSPPPKKASAKLLDCIIDSEIASDTFTRGTQTRGVQPTKP